MAKKDVILYFLQVQDQYFEMVENVKELGSTIKENPLEQELFDNLQRDIDIIKNNYERLAYIMMLLNKPTRKKSNKRESIENRYWYDYLKGSSKEAIIDENKDALSDFKKMVRETRNDN